MKTVRTEYPALIERVHDAVRHHVAEGSVVAFVSRGDEDLVHIEGYRGWHFPRGEAAEYAGHHPATSVEALVHLRHLYSQGARYLVFPATATWWLEHYQDLAEHLDSDHACLFRRPDVCVIYELRQSTAFDAFTADADGDDGEWVLEAGSTAAADIRTVAPPAAPDRIRILTILARYGTDQYATAQQSINDLFARQMADVDRRTLIVDNALPRDLVVTNTDGPVLLGGENADREFSAFDRALEFAGDDIWSYDFIHFATSAFNTLYVDYLARFDTDLLRAAAGRPACVGHIDCYNEPIELGVFTAQHWIRSCFFLLSPSDVRLLGTCAAAPAHAELFSGDPAHPFLPQAPLSERYRAFITDWLTGPGLGQGVEWHSTFALTDETLRAFEDKARAILNEQLLSIRLQALGCRLVDVTWLSTLLREGVTDIPWATPWRDQIEAR